MDRLETVISVERQQDQYGDADGYGDPGETESTANCRSRFRPCTVQTADLPPKHAESIDESLDRLFFVGCTLDLLVRFSPIGMTAEEAEQFGNRFR